MAGEHTRPRTLRLVLVLLLVRPATSFELRGLICGNEPLSPETSNTILYLSY